MFFFFPYATDAPIYHWPVVTVLLILINVAVFVATGCGEHTPIADALVLHFDHFRATEWVTSNFMHADILHLLGNMVFLWPFGLVVEGKLGWWRFLAVYLGIGALFGAVVQMAMLPTGSHNVSLGASAVLFGLLALAVVWAPKNEL